MKALQCLSLEPDGRVTANVGGRVRYFASIDALADWLHPQPEPDSLPAVIVTHRWQAGHVESQPNEREYAA